MVQQFYCRFNVYNFVGRGRVYDGVIGFCIQCYYVEVGGNCYFGI